MYGIINLKSVTHIAVHFRSYIFWPVLRLRSLIPQTGNKFMTFRPFLILVIRPDDGFSLQLEHGAFILSEYDVVLAYCNMTLCIHIAI